MEVILTESVSLPVIQSLPQLLHVKFGGIVCLCAVVVHRRGLTQRWELLWACCCHGYRGRTSVPVTLNVVVLRNFRNHLTVVLTKEEKN